MDSNQTSSAKTDQAQFTQHLEKATEIVRSWPAWKQAVLGGLTTKDSSCDQDANPSLGDKNEENNQTAHMQEGGCNYTARGTK